MICSHAGGSGYRLGMDTGGWRVKISPYYLRITISRKRVLIIRLQAMYDELPFCFGEKTSIVREILHEKKADKCNGYRSQTLENEYPSPKNGLGVVSL